ncbi:MAG: acetamidase/formamidase family protein [bacterium]|nr:acetamidase/formamidase family protein [bacterium]
MRRLTRDRTSFFFDGGQEPAISVEQGESVVVETQDAHSGTITGPEIVYETLDDVMARIGGANPVTGPISVDGVRAGDCVQVHIERVEGAPVTGFGYMNTTPTLHPSFKAETVICHRSGDRVAVPTARGPVMVPCRPFVGTIGVAPAGEPVLSFRQGTAILGNVDLPDVRAGSTVVLRAAVDGALVSLGDAHLAQGDAEIHRSAIECQADVVLNITRSTPEEVGFSGLPQVNTTRAWGSVSPGPGHLEDLVRAAYDDLARRLRHTGRFSLAEAYRLLGAVGTVRVGQVVPPVYSAMAAIDRRYVRGC